MIPGGPNRAYFFNSSISISLFSLISILYLSNPSSSCATSFLLNTFASNSLQLSHHEAVNIAITGFDDSLTTLLNCSADIVLKTTPEVVDVGADFEVNGSNGALALVAPPIAPTMKTAPTIKHIIENNFLS